MMESPSVASSEEGTTAVSCVVLTTLELIAFPFHLTLAALVKFVPLMVSVVSGLPARIAEGVIDVICTALADLCASAV